MNIFAYLITRSTHEYSCIPDPVERLKVRMNLNKMRRESDMARCRDLRLQHGRCSDVQLLLLLLRQLE